MTGRAPGLDVERLSLDTAASHLLEECRTIVPGVQAVFGFQLVAVFSQGFDRHLSAGEQRLHLGALALVVVAMALVMAPAALHRQAEPRTVSGRFLRVASRMLLLSLAPLALGICLDVYLVARVILGASGWAAALATALCAALGTFWYALPRHLRRRWAILEHGGEP
ncbi:DUF6328 family protein [Gemmatirosa kalamazoonensis]|uniref:DUF6328 family protein n=1 Tax=Gemmatirosa kalamazoonensis TaxID=861299 RepID=UPI0011DDCAF0|nr:DUF6328 family protein [Gemmatirosa kalamazoonensis]